MIDSVANYNMVVLPTGVERYGIDPDQVDVARAVRMSMSIPFFFEPIKFRGSYFVDGGILSNFPVWLFDSPGIPEWPTFGFKLVEPEAGRPNSTSTPVRFTKAIISTMMEAHDKQHVETEDFPRWRKWRWRRFTFSTNRHNKRIICAKHNHTWGQRTLARWLSGNQRNLFTCG
jgi:predicted acylesterase/phospholipase RssA